MIDKGILVLLLRSSLNSVLQSPCAVLCLRGDYSSADPSEIFDIMTFNIITGACYLGKCEIKLSISPDRIRDLAVELCKPVVCDQLHASVFLTTKSQTQPKWAIAKATLTS